MKKRSWLMLILILFILNVGCAMGQDEEKKTDNSLMDNKFQKATFAGGCFWCMQPPFDKLDGVISTKAGYTGGTIPDPTYEEVCSGRTGYAEAVEVIYDSSRITYIQLLEVFWMNIDPTTKNRQFADSGSQYRTAVFYHDEKQKELAQKSKENLEASGKFSSTIVTEVVPADTFYAAEAYHQDYYKKNPFHYNSYKIGSGRAGYLKKTWGDKK